MVDEAAGGEAVARGRIPRYDYAGGGLARKGLMTQGKREDGRSTMIRRRGKNDRSAGNGTTGTIKMLPSGGGIAGGIRIGRGATGTALDGDTVLLRRCGSRGGREFYAVGKVLSRKGGMLFGTVARVAGSVTIEPDDLHLPERILLPIPEVDGEGGVGAPKKGDIVGFRITRWDQRRAAPRGVISELVGRVGDPRACDRLVIRKYGLSPDFPLEVLNEAREASRRAPSGGCGEDRLDLRGELVVTIDPDDSRDFDDAIGVDETTDGWKLSVHIADVGHYVSRGGMLDAEAARRGNSTYLPGKVIPMLPEELSNGVCSLLPGEDRHSFSVFLDIRRDGTVGSVRFAKCLIRSGARLTYGRALDILSKEPEGNVESMIHRAHALAQALRSRRAEQGSLFLDFPETRAILGADGSTLGFDVSRGDDAHRLVEECMLAANEAVGARLREAGVDGIYRVHGAPEDRELLAFLAEAEGSLGGETGRGGCLRGRVNKAILEAKGRADERSLLSILMKSMKKAAYSHTPLGHYGLSKSDYTHFTSPIRRYADLMVHRALEGALTGDGKLGCLAEVAKKLADTETNSAAAERAALHERKFEYLGRLLRTTGTQTMEAVVVESGPRQMIVDVDAVALRCSIPLTRDAEGPMPKPGARIQVHIRRVERRGRKVEFAVADGGEVAGRMTPGERQRKRRGRRRRRRIS